jgi:enoyl-CoA hydratase/carnithine racemase
MTDSLVTLERRDDIAWIGLNRAAKRNAISDALLAALDAAVEQAQRDARAIVVFGHGPCFSAGLDLGEHRARTTAEVFDHSRGWHRVFRRIRTGRVPAIAAIHGACVGGGLELASACHIRLAEESAFFALPEGTRGIYVGGGASVHTARLLGAARMMDMMLTGRPLDAATAERIGLVTYLTPVGEGLGKAGEIAAKVAKMAPLTVLGVLQALPRIQDMGEEDGLFVESMMAALAQSGPDAQARLTDFVEKRAPKAGEA